MLRHRRPLAAVFAGLAVLLALGALRSEPPGGTVVVAARDLASGSVLAADDVLRMKLPVQATPAHSVRHVDEIVGRTVAGPMRRGEVLTDRRIVDADRLSGFPSGTVLSSVRLADPDALTNLRVGDHVDVVAVDPDGGAEAEVVARGVEIITLPAGGDESSGVSIGVATSEDDALHLAERALDARLSVLASHSWPTRSDAD